VRRLVAVALAAALAGAAADASAAATWRSRIAAATRYAEGRAGLVSFAVVDESGRLHGYRARAIAPSASVLKAMLLVAYLRKADVRGRALQQWERDLLGPMIRRSNNAAASTVLGLVGSAGVYRVARLADMASFRLRLPIWGLSEITARDQARFFYRIDSYVPARHRRYALRLLATIVDSQRWGVARVSPPGWRLYFKGGWGSGTGLVDHQVALLRASGERVSLAVLTRFNPDHAYGKKTLRGVAARLLRRVPRPLFRARSAARFAYDAGHTAALGRGCARLRIRSFADERAVVRTGAAGCASVRLALAGPRALWSWREAPRTHVRTAALDDPARTEVATLEAGEVLRRVAGAGSTLVFSQDAYDSGGSFVDGQVNEVGGGSCPVPERARIAAAGGRFAVGSDGSVEVRDLDTCELIAAFGTAPTVESVALAGDFAAALVRRADGVRRIERYAVSSATRLGATRVSRAAGPRLDLGGGRIVYRGKRGFVALSVLSGRWRRLWDPRRVPVGFGLGRRRLVWMENFGGRARAWMVVLPRV
jgi:hypothetical protein